MTNNHSHMLGINSHIEMGSIDGTSVTKLEDESLVSPQPMDRTTRTLDVAPHRSFFEVGIQEFGCKYILNSTIKIIKIILFSSKINLLASCGPLSMVVDKLTNHHVSCNFLGYNIFRHRRCISFSHIISRMGILSQFIRHHSTGRTFGLDYRVRF
ncbi:uncharacterized protein LOC111376645 [Olea europaea var. sylvestris]|uniref:uncharacterized protein LOC111376645 n=1 Tax=Olea europaea var. sylvestris TaxID=158386 RepID=UPI000C1CE682|nr:uncharacterized protein LOC111376645 [Olea europaea var. sylvestris]